MTVKTDPGNVVAVLTENTDVSARKGRLGLIRKDAAATALIPGLKVGVEGVGDDKGRLIATKVRFASGDLKTARAIEAGLAETEAQVAANQQGIETNRKPSATSRTSRPASAGAWASSASTTSSRGGRLFRGRQRGDPRGGSAELARDRGQRPRTSRAT